MSLVILLILSLTLNLTSGAPTEIEGTCEWFGSGPNCTDLVKCPEGWKLLKEATGTVEEENCTERTERYCCDANIFDYSLDVNMNTVGTRTGKSMLRTFGKHNKIQILAKGGITEEARLILPMTTNDGKPLTALQKKLERKILKGFGGYTRFDAKGGYIDDAGTVYMDAVWVYDIVAVNRPEDRKKLEDIAKWLKVEAEQESIYLRYPGGMVTFV